MFTGIIFFKGEVIERNEVQDGGLRLILKAPEVISMVKNGSSISVNGICLTVKEKTRDTFAVDVMPKTVSMTTIQNWKVGTFVNLEPSMRMGDELGGHFVYGHVDGIGTVKTVKQQGNATLVEVVAPPGIFKYVSPQGSIGVNGISLTIADVSDDSFTVSLIPETLRLTTFREISEGDQVNLEADMLMKYVETCVKHLYGKHSSHYR